MEGYGNNALGGKPMLKIFLYPLWIIIGLIFLTVLGVASDVAQLTNFNILHLITKHAPQSYLYIGLSTLILYFLLVVIGLVRNSSQPSGNTSAANSPAENSPIPSQNNVTQTITTRDVNNSTINQSVRDTRK